MKTDQEIKQRVMDELSWDPSLDASKIGVIVNQGIVDLIGHVATYKEKTLAEHIAARVHGVKAVVQDLEVKIQVGTKKTDEEIAEAAVNTMRWHSSIPDNIHLKVEDSWITVEGTVNWNFQKDEVSKMLSNIKGVRGVSNRLAIAPKVQPEALLAKIRKALERNALLNAANISVKIMDDKVILEGTVQSLAEKRQAEKEAAAAPGISDVVNNLLVRTEEMVY